MVLAMIVIESILDGLAVFYSLIGATLLVPVVGGLFVKRAGSREALVSIACGSLALLGVQYGTDRTGWWNPNLWGLLASAAGYAMAASFRRN